MPLLITFIYYYIWLSIIHMFHCRAHKVCRITFEYSIVKTNECSNVCFTYFAQLIMENSSENYVLTYIMTPSLQKSTNIVSLFKLKCNFNPLISIFCIYKIELTTFYYNYHSYEGLIKENIY